MSGRSLSKLSFSKTLSYLRNDHLIKFNVFRAKTANLRFTIFRKNKTGPVKFLKVEKKAWDKDYVLFCSLAAFSFVFMSSGLLKKFLAREKELEITATDKTRNVRF